MLRQHWKKIAITAGAVVVLGTGSIYLTHTQIQSKTTASLTEIQTQLANAGLSLSWSGYKTDLLGHTIVLNDLVLKNQTGTITLSAPQTTLTAANLTTGQDLQAQINIDQLQTRLITPDQVITISGSASWTQNYTGGLNAHMFSNMIWNGQDMGIQDLAGGTEQHFQLSQPLTIEKINLSDLASGQIDTARAIRAGKIQLEQMKLPGEWLKPFDNPDLQDDMTINLSSWLVDNSKSEDGQRVIQLQNSQLKIQAGDVHDQLDIEKLDVRYLLSDVILMGQAIPTSASVTLQGVMLDWSDVQASLPTLAHPRIDLVGQFNFDQQTRDAKIQVKTRVGNLLAGDLDVRLAGLAPIMDNDQPSGEVGHLRLTEWTSSLAAPALMHDILSGSPQLTGTINGLIAAWSYEPVVAKAKPVAAVNSKTAKGKKGAKAKVVTPPPAAIAVTTPSQTEAGIWQAFINGAHGITLHMAPQNNGISVGELTDLILSSFLQTLSGGGDTNTSEDNPTPSTTSDNSNQPLPEMLYKFRQRLGITVSAWPFPSFMIDQPTAETPTSDIPAAKSENSDDAATPAPAGTAATPSTSTPSTSATEAPVNNSVAPTPATGTSVP